MKILCLLALLVLLGAAKDFTFYQHSDPAAKCLDGTQSGFYYQKVSLSKKFLVYFQGGALCSGLTYQGTLKNCYQRSLTHLGSSAQYPKSRSFDDFSYLSTETSNPFHDWNRIFIPYCDGSLHQGSKTQPVVFNETNLYFRGTNNTLAHFKALNQKFGFFAADEIIVTGTSAGGVASFIWANYVFDNAIHKDRILVVPDNGTFIINFPNKYNITFIKATQQLFLLVNSQIDMPLSECVNEYQGIQEYCFESGVAVDYVKPKTFFIQSQYDTWGIDYILLLTCAPDPNPTSLQACDSTEKASIQEYRVKINEAMTNVISFEKNGAWSISCAQHGFLQDLNSFISPNYLIPTTVGTDMTRALLDFKSGKGKSYIDVAKWPDNIGCNGIKTTKTASPSSQKKLFLLDMPTDIIQVLRVDSRKLQLAIIILLNQSKYQPSGKSNSQRTRQHSWLKYSTEQGQAFFSHKGLSFLSIYSYSICKLDKFLIQSVSPQIFQKRHQKNVEKLLIKIRKEPFFHKIQKSSIFLIFYCPQFMLIKLLSLQVYLVQRGILLEAKTFGDIEAIPSAFPNQRSRVIVSQKQTKQSKRSFDLVLLIFLNIVLFIHRIYFSSNHISHSRI